MSLDGRVIGWMAKPWGVVLFPISAVFATGLTAALLPARRTSATLVTARAPDVQRRMNDV